MTFATEFPDFPAADMPALPASFVDCSWKNDTCPSIMSDDLGLLIFIDYADASLREFPDSKRFIITNEDGACFLDTDDWAAVLAFIAEAS